MSPRTPPSVFGLVGATPRRRLARREDIGRGTFVTDGRTLWEVRAVRESAPQVRGRLRDAPVAREVLVEDVRQPAGEGARWLSLEEVLALELVRAAHSRAA